jgi:hypothetical protein
MLALCNCAISQQASQSVTGHGEPPENNTASTAESGQTDKRGTREIPFVVDLVAPPDAEAKATAEQKHREYQTASEYRLAVATEGLLWATIVLASAAIFQIGLFWYQLRLMRRAVGDAAMAARAAQDSADAAKDGVKLARKAFTADQRPWVSVVISIISPVTYDQAGSAQITFRFTLRNVGRSPATNVDVFPKIYPSSNKRLLARLEQKQMADIARIPSPPEEFFGDIFLGDVLFPGSEPMTIEMRLTVNRGEIDAAIAEIGAEHRYFVPVIVGSVGYGFTFEGGRHQTGFIAEVLKIEDTPKSGFAIDLGETIPPEKLRLRHRFGASVD